MKLSTKLFLILLGVTATMLLMAVGLARYSFQQGFLEFVGGMEEVRLQKVAQELVIEYESNDSAWQWLNEQGLESIMSARQMKGLPKPRYEGSSNPPRIGDNPNRQGRHQPPPHGRPRGPLNETTLPQGPATAVFDQSGKFIAGNDKSDLDEAMFVVALFSNNQQIGELRSWPNVEGSSELSTLFARQQFWSSIVIAIFCLLLASAVSWLLARKLLIPIQQLRHSISILNAGKYGDKMSTSRTDELGELMDNVDNLSQTLDKNRSAKSRMFADISHELRTPLTVLAGEIELLKAGIRKFDQANLLSLEQESNRLRHLVDDLYQLSLSDIGGLKYTFTVGDFSSCLSNHVNGFTQRALDQGIQISTKITPKISFPFDEKRIEQLFSNLLLNAIAYTDSPGYIQVILTLDKHELQLTINDSAPSVSKEQCNNLFDPLYRLDASRTRRESGAGLGLAISKNIVEAHQGTITASPSSLGGLCMLITLPIIKPLV
jgi:two-component system sensor histidine kinase BaeS